MNINLEQTILRNILTNEQYMRKVLPFVKPDYFEGVYRVLYKEIGKFVGKYNKLPTLEAFKIELDKADKINEEQYAHALEIIPNIFHSEKVNDQWLLDTTEKWCQDRAIYNAIMESISIIDGKHQDLTKNALPDLLQKALAVSFDTNIGHDYVENVEQRYDFYHEQEERIPFDLRNALYITMEMAEERIAERIDANLLNIPIDQLEYMPKPIMMTKVGEIANKTNGKLIIKEYPTGQANTSHFRALLNELKLKKNFIPDIIFIDYLNICASARMKGMGGAINSYSYIKAIAEEIRGLAVEFNVPIVSATQTTRSGFGSSDPGLEDTSESFGLPATADLMFALVSNDELAAQNQILVKQLKNRYNDPNMHKRFVISVDRSKMKLSDAPDAKENLVQDVPVMDNSNTAQQTDKFKDFVVF